MTGRVAAEDAVPNAVKSAPLMLPMNRNGKLLVAIAELRHNYQGWGAPAVQYLQTTPVLGNLVPVTDWRSYFYDSGIVRTCTGCQVLPYTRTGGLGTGGHLRNFPIPAIN